MFMLLDTELSNERLALMAVLQYTVYTCHNARRAGTVLAQGALSMFPQAARQAVAGHRRAMQLHDRAGALGFAR